MECWSVLAAFLAIFALALVVLQGARLGALQRRLRTLEKSLAALRPTAEPSRARAAEAELRIPEPPAAPAPESRPEPPPPPPRELSGELPPALSAEAAREPAPVTSPRRPDASSRGLESKIGARWLVLAGAATLFLGVAFLLKYSFDRGWFGPTSRVLSGSALGCALFLRGWLWHRRYPALAYGFCGAGSALLYAVVWSAHWLYALIPHGLAFGLMAAITATTWLAALRLRALTLAILAIVGGFAAPLLLPASSDAPHGLLAYAVLLSGAALALRWIHSWPVLSGVAVAGVTTHFVAWCVTHAPLATQAWSLSAWAIAFALLFLLGLPVLASLRRQAQHPLDLATVGGTAVLCLLVNLLVFADDARWPKAGMALGEAALYAAAAWLHRLRVRADARGVEALLLPAAALLVAAAPIAFGHSVLTVVLALLGMLLLNAARPLEAPSVSVVGLVSLAWAVLRVLEHRMLFALPRAVFGTSREAPFVGPAGLAELVVIAALALLGCRSRLPTARQRTSLLAALLLLVLWAGGETTAVLVDARWPHASRGFDIAIAWAWPLALIGMVAGHAERAGRSWSGAAFVLQQLALAAALAAAALGTELPRDLRWLVQAVALLAPILAAGVAARRTPRPAWVPAMRVDPAAASAGTALLVAVAGELGHVAPEEVGAGAYPAGPPALCMTAAGLALVMLIRNAQALEPMRVARAMALAAALPFAVALAELGARRAGWPGEAVRALAARDVALLAAALALAGPSRGPAARFVSALAALTALVLPLAWLDRLQAVRSLPTVNVPFAVAAAPAIAVLAARWKDLRSRAARAAPAHACLLVLVVLLSFESYGFGRHLESGGDSVRSAHAALSVCWTACATALLALGIALPARVPRIGGLVLFALTLAKLVAIDLAALPLPYRIVSFMGCGLALMGGGWLYNRFAARIGAPREEP